MNKKKILILVEGAKTDVRLMKHLIKIYKIDVDHEIISYNTNIYTLYSEMFIKNDPEDMDILQILKARESDKDVKKLFDQKYTDILLIFDLDPHDPLYTEDKIIKMVGFFIESTDMGKLYLNYPMVESFYHMKDIPDKDYNNSCATLSELNNKTYKKRVNKENRDRNYSSFACNRKECNIVIKQNISKAFSILGQVIDRNIFPQQADILEVQLEKMKEEKMLYILCTCASFITDYNSILIEEDNL